MNHSLLARYWIKIMTQPLHCTVPLDTHTHNFHNLSVDVWGLGLWLSNLDAYLT